MPAQAIILDINHRDLANARRLHAVQMAAYAQEAQLLGIADFPPLRLSVAELAAQEMRYFAVSEGDAVLAALALEATAERSIWRIASVVVAPNQQRRGWARRLLQEVVRRHPEATLEVSTAANNLPACQLYLALGFSPTEQTWVPLHNCANGVASERLCLQHFRRTPGSPTTKTN